MAYRCPDCNRFVSTELDEPEIESCEIEETTKGKATIHIVATINRVCAECGEQLAQGTLDADIEIVLPGFEAM